MNLCKKYDIIRLVLKIFYAAMGLSPLSKLCYRTGLMKGVFGGKMTIEDLQAFGANVREGLERCLGDEDFYLEMVKMGIEDERFEAIEDFIRDGKTEEAFEAVHALKGIVSNLVLTPILEPLCELTELLRAKKSGDYVGLCKKIKSEREKLLSL